MYVRYFLEGGGGGSVNMKPFLKVTLFFYYGISCELIQVCSLCLIIEYRGLTGLRILLCKAPKKLVVGFLKAENEPRDYIVDIISDTMIRETALIEIKNYKIFH